MTQTPENSGILKLAIIAVGGQGGGVLTNWIESMARAQGYACQATSVAGVAQRTGATIYYVEMMPATAQQPVFSLAPSAGDVDVVIAAEMMEAGRAVQRGFVTPDRTTLIASTHRALSVSEKIAPGDGTADSDAVKAAAEIAARQLVMYDFDHAALASGSVISASLFGALAGSGCLPFSRPAFEQAIHKGGKGVTASLRAFAAGFELAQNKTPQHATPATTDNPETAVSGPKEKLAQWQRLCAQINDWPAEVQEMAQAGLRKVVDFQDLQYGTEYLDHVAGFLAKDDPENRYELTNAAAKYIANAMAYDDIIRVADLKTRAGRFQRINQEMGLNQTQHLRLTEYFHPRADELIGLLPARLGERLQSSPKWPGRIDRWFSKGRRISSNGFAGFALLYLVAGQRGWRRKTLRHTQEVQHLRAWLALAHDQIATDYNLAVELIRCQRLIKGYSDTHARGQSKFQQVTGALAKLAGRQDAADWIARLRTAALKDEKGEALNGALKTLASFS